MSFEGLCAKCITDPYLRSVVKDQADGDTACVVCNATPAMPIDDVAKIVEYGLQRRFDNPASLGVPPGDGDNGYPVFTEDSLLDVLRTSFPEIGDDVVLSAVADAIGDDGHVWASVDWDGRFPDDRLLDAWEEFTTSIASRGRFLSVLLEPEFDFRPKPDPKQLLDEIGAHTLAENLIVTLPAGTELWRARVAAAAEPAWGAKELGTPPAEHARGANRMSPVGLPLFYGAAERDTAIAETVYRSRGGEWVMTGRFSLDSDVQILDLAAIPDAPSLFDRSEAAHYYPRRFLKAWASRLSFPARDDWAMLDYIPTQVVTEYFLRLFEGGGKVRGIRYPSVQRPGSACLALDISNAYCVSSAADRPTPDPLLPPTAPLPCMIFDGGSATQDELRIATF